MTQNETRQKQDKDTLASFAGVAVMFAFLIIIFALTTPGVLGGSDANQDSADVESVEVAQAVDDATEEAVATEEATEAPVETEEAVATEEATEAPVETEEVVVTEEATEDEASVSETAASYDPEIVAEGESLFITCSACHGADALGIPGLGKDLVYGEFTNATSDEDLVAMIMAGRPVWDAENTTMVDMPPRGGNPMLNEDGVVAIVAYLRTLAGDANADVSEPVEESADASTDDSASSGSDDTATAYDAESIANGESLFITCSACHGADGTGIPGLGKDLVAGEFSLNASDEELAALITSGRPVWDAENTTMVDMPPRGGNPTLNEDDVNDLVAYIRSIQTP